LKEIFWSKLELKESFGKKIFPKGKIVNHLVNKYDDISLTNYIDQFKDKSLNYNSLIALLFLLD